MKGTLAVVILALAAVLAACGGDTGDDDDSGSARSESRTDSDRAAGEAAPAGTATSGGGTAGDVASQDSSFQRKVIFTSTIALQVDDVAMSFTAVQRLARESGGYVEESSMSRSNDEEGPKSATLTLRVPADRNGDVIASLRTIPGATVASESSRSTEVTEEYTDLQSRLRNLERTEAQYLELLAKATSIEDILTVSDRLNTVRGQIEQAQGRVAVLDDLVDLATIDVSLAAVVARAQGSGDSGPSSFVEAFEGAWEAATEAGRYALAASAVLLVAAIWLAGPAIIVVAGVVVARRLGRRTVASE
ncbi:MAG: DUF4349 domain-containing protein [Dehalococcoidia bacterium]|nr:DUF4349 domain-containing protein [Dehalococcoidia bacterium]